MSKPDFTRVTYPSIGKLFHDAGIEGPKDLIPVCYNGNKKEYLKQVIRYSLNVHIEQVWEGYKNAHPAISWQTEMIRFGFLYTRKTDAYIYHKEEPYAGISKGQVYLVNLHLLGEKLQIAVAHEVDLVDEKEKIIKLCYLNTGKTAGSQWIKFIDAGSNRTEIEHLTLYKGTSFVRDRLLYPIFHKRAMNQFHHRMKELIVDKS